ncbi:MAG: hypothetical protein AAFY15_00875 [Cyanobacteria bacterium J06648_11]
MKQLLTLLQQATATDSLVVVRFPDGTDCTATDYGVLPDMIRLIKQLLNAGAKMSGFSSSVPHRE